MIHRQVLYGAAIGLGLSAAVIVGLAVAQDLDGDGSIVSEEMLVEDAVNGALDDDLDALLGDDLLTGDDLLLGDDLPVGFGDVDIEDDGAAEPQVEAEPLAEIEPQVEADPFAEIEPLVEAEPFAEIEPLVEAEPLVEVEPILEAVEDIDLAVDDFDAPATDLDSADQAIEEVEELLSEVEPEEPEPAEAFVEMVEEAGVAPLAPIAETADQAATNLDDGNDLDLVVEGAFMEAFAEGVPDPPAMDLGLADVESDPEPEMEALLVETEDDSLLDGDMSVALDDDLDLEAQETAPLVDPLVEEVVAMDDEPLDVLIEAPVADMALADESLEDLLVDDIDEPVAMEEEMVEIVEEEPDEEPVAEVVDARQPEVEVADAMEAEPTPEPTVAEVSPEDAAKTAMVTTLDVMMKQEELRRQALEAHGREVLREAEKSAAARDYKEAERQFEEALRYIADRPDTLKTRSRVRAGMAENYFNWANAQLRRQDVAAARDLGQRALSLKHPGAARFLEDLDKKPIEVVETAPEVPRRRAQQQDFIDKQASIKELLRTGRQHLINGELDRAQGKFEAVLHPSLDPHNTEAMRMIQKVAQKRYDRAAMEVEGTRRDMMTEVRKAWNPRDYGLAEADAQKTKTVKPGKKDDDSRTRIRLKMESIKIPEIDFRQANIHDVIEFLQRASADYDSDELPDDERGVNIILKLQTDASVSAKPLAAPLDPFADMVAAGGGASGNGGVPLITFTARYISLMEALKIVTQVANLKYRIEGSVVMIVPFNDPDGDIVVRMYDVLPAVEEKIRIVREEVGGDNNLRGGGDFISIEAQSVDRGTADWKGFFGSMGVDWPAKSSIQYVRTIGKIVVANTEKNLAVFEQVLEVLNVVPSQIEIEARFVEVTQTDLDSLGFEWLMNDSWQLAQKAGQANLPAAARQRIELSAGPNGSFTGGNRFVPETLGDNVTALDSVLKISGVLTNPELALVLHMLQQRGHADLLSAPKVTTKSGNEAEIKVVTEYIYPTEFEVTPITAQQDGVSTIVGGVVEPSTFETREVGVILSVLPEVSTESQMINLNMTPQVVSDPTWYEYGSRFTDADGNEQLLAMPQPFFHTRSVNTSISIYNGATVVMGGMITEVRTDVDDKVPFLGDLPLIGRLFRSSYERSEKRNLLIFVTARLVDPNGLPIKKQETTEIPVGMVTPPAN